MIKNIREQSKKLAIALNTKGLINVQIAIQKDDIYILEANPRASRTIPFISKALRLPIVEWATRICLGAKLGELGIHEDFDLKMENVYVKKPVFPFARFPGIDPLLGPEMKSTGEVMGWDKSLPLAYTKAIQGAYIKLPVPGSIIFLSIRNEDKEEIIKHCQHFINMGFSIEATSGTADYLRSKDLSVQNISKSFEPGYNCVQAIEDKRFSLVINTAMSPQAIKDSYVIRRSALENSILCINTMAELDVLIHAIDEYRSKPITVQALQDRGAV